MLIFVAARDLAGAAFIGTHQFIIILPHKSTLPLVKNVNGNILQPQDLGDGQLGFVICAHNTGRLTVKYFEADDYKATREHFNSGKYKSWYKSDFDTEVKQVVHSFNDELFIKLVLNLVVNYSINESIYNIPYPAAGFGYNSNSWVQSLILSAKGVVEKDFSGFDVASMKVIPETYFKPICPVNPRPLLNQ